MENRKKQKQQTSNMEDLSPIISKITCCIIDLTIAIRRKSWQSREKSMVPKNVVYKKFTSETT